MGETNCHRKTKVLQSFNGFQMTYFAIHFHTTQPENITNCRTSIQKTLALTGNYHVHYVPSIQVDLHQSLHNPNGFISGRNKTRGQDAISWEATETALNNRVNPPGMCGARQHTVRDDPDIEEKVRFLVGDCQDEDGLVWMDQIQRPPLCCRLDFLL